MWMGEQITVKEYAIENYWPLMWIGLLYSVGKVSLEM